MPKTYILGDREKQDRAHIHEDLVKQQRYANDEFIKRVIDTEISPDMDAAQLLEARKSIDEARNMVAEASNAIRSQLDEVNERRYRDGEYADPNWWRRLNGAARAKAWQRQRLQDKLGEVSRLLRGAEHNKTMRYENERRKTQERMFVEVAKLQLSQEAYQRIWDMVDQIAQQQENNTGE
jgi:ribosome-binding protein aMBF1 (putative translation factor)